MGLPHKQCTVLWLQWTDVCIIGAQQSHAVLRALAGVRQRAGHTCQLQLGEQQMTALQYIGEGTFAQVFKVTCCRRWPPPLLPVFSLWGGAPSLPATPSTCSWRSSCRLQSSACWRAYLPNL